MIKLHSGNRVDTKKFDVLEYVKMFDNILNDNR